MKIAVTGATGFVGTRLVERLEQDGHGVVVLTRNAGRAQKCFPATAFPGVEVVTYAASEAGEWQQAIAGCDGVVNLAGEPIAEKRWSPEQKALILNSRVLGTQRLVEAIAAASPRPQVLVNASAIGFYGTSETATFVETNTAGNDFLAEVCQQWEAAAEKVKALGTRLVILRLGIVLANGGAIAKMLPPFKAFAGGPIGTGKQWFSWVQREDVVSLILKALTDGSMQGIYNATAPNPVQMEELCLVLGEVINRPSWLPVPGLALELLLGDGAKVVLEGQKVLPERTQATGFVFQYPELKGALEAFLKG